MTDLFIMWLRKLQTSVCYTYNLHCSAPDFWISYIVVVYKVIQFSLVKFFSAETELFLTAAAENLNACYFIGISLRSSRFLSFSKCSRTGVKLRKSGKISSRGMGWGDGQKRLQWDPDILPNAPKQTEFPWGTNCQPTVTLEPMIIDFR